MILKKTIFLLVWLFTLSTHLHAKTDGGIFSNDLPSEQTEHELQSMTASLPELRQAPNEDGYAQKEIPLGHPDFSVIFLLACAATVYYFKKSRRKKAKDITLGKNKLILAFAAIVVGFSAQSISAQLVFQANPDNAFVQPNSTSYTPIDILVNDYYNLGSSLDCNRSGLQISLWNGTAFVSAAVNGTLGRARVSADNQIEYRPQTDKYGADKITYQIHCPATGSTSQADIYINVNDKPDAINDANCYVDPQAMTWGISELASSKDTRVVVSSNVWTGDIDGDGQIEILALRSDVPNLYSQSRAYDGIVVYVMSKDGGGNDILTLKYDIIIEPSLGHPHEGVVIANVDGGASSAIFFTSHTGVLYKYVLSGGNYVEDRRVTFGDRNLDNYYRVGVPVIADLMGDGHQQIILYDKIFDASTLTLLADAHLIPATGFSSYSFGSGGHSLNYDQYASAMLAVDIDDDGKMEIIGGDCVYEVNLTNYNGTAGNTYNFLRRAKTSGRSDIYDGLTAIADIDLNGKVDIIVSSPMIKGVSSTGSLYVYNPRTGTIMHTNMINNIPKNGNGAPPTSYIFGPSAPFVGDIDADGAPEICVTGAFVLNAYDYNISNHTLNLRWSLPTSDLSASTTISLFDFTQSGKSQLIYRDQTQLRILEDRNGTPTVLARFNNIFSPTINEYCIVADVNQDGAAEIIVTGADRLVNPSGDPLSTGNYYGNGPLRVYASATTSWAPARTVWNQFGYNPLHVNDDLTIPSRPISPATSFFSADGTVTRPFNNFLQQSTSLNREGTMIMLGPDLTFDPRIPKRLKFDTSDNLNITVGVINQGDAIFSGPISLQLYAYIQASNTYVKVGVAHSYANTSGLPFETPNNAVTISYTIPNISGSLPTNYDNLVMTANLSTSPQLTPSFIGSNECHGGYNNFASGFSLVNGERVMCEGETETLTLEGAGSYTVKWFDTATGGNLVNTGSSMNIIKNADPIQYYFVESYASPTAPNPITNIRDTVFVYMAPDSLVWTAKGSTPDWNDWQNWSDPSELLSPKACIPRACTNVQFLSGTSIYPNLDASRTSYASYSSAECNNVHFAHGGEVARPDMLKYTKAFVDVTFNSHRWHMFAPPLKNFYTGDIYINDIIPANDIIKTYTKYWARRNPWTNHYTAGWTGIFHQPNQSFAAGQAFGVWISDKSVSGQATPPRDPFEFSFPKNESQFYVYVEDTTYPDLTDPNNPYQTPRTNSHRFIFDGVAAGANFNLTVDGESKTAGQFVLVGNPFIAHLDFDKFYAANSSFIQNYYVILDENAVQQHYNKDGSSTLSKNIAPMQAFLVEVKAPFANLIANGTMTLSIPGDKLKAAPIIEDILLKVTASQAEKSHASFIKISDTGKNRYTPGEDIAMLFPSASTSDSRAPILYSRTEDGIKVSLNSINTENLAEKEIPLGLWMPKALKSAPLTLNISNLNMLPAQYSLYLYDKQNEKEHDLSANSMLTVEDISTDSDLFADGRFFLRFAYKSSAIEEEQHEEVMSAFIEQGLLRVETSDYIEEISIYNIQGQLIKHAKPMFSSFEMQVGNDRLYIVRARLSKQTIVKKILNIR